MSVFLSVDSLVNGALLKRLPTWLTGYAQAKNVLVPAEGAQVWVRPRGDAVDTVSVFPNGDGTGAPLAQPLVADADGRLAGFVSQPALLDIVVAVPGFDPHTIKAGLASELLNFADVHVVASDAAMLAIPIAHEGTVAVRSDLHNAAFMHNGGSAGTDADWVQIGFVPTLDGVPSPLGNVSLANFKILNLADATADTDALNRRSGDGRFGQLAAANAWTQPQTWKQKTAVTYQAGAFPFYVSPVGASSMQFDQYGTFILGPSLALELGTIAGQSTGDIHNLTPDLVFTLSDLRLHTRHVFIKECANPANFFLGRWPGTYPYTKGWTTSTAGFNLPAVGAASLNVPLTDSSGFGSGGAPLFAIVRDGTHQAFVQYDTFAGNILHITNVIEDSAPGVPFSAGSSVSDALTNGTTLGLMYSNPWLGGIDGWRGRSAQIHFKLREHARPDIANDGEYHLAGSITFQTSCPGPNSQHTDRMVWDETGSFALIGGAITNADNINRRASFDAPTAALRQHTSVVGAFTLPGAGTITVSDVITSDFPAAGQVQIPSTGGTQTVNYTGLDTTGGYGNHKLTGCTGGVGNVASGAAVTLVVTLPGSGGPNTLSVTDASQFSKSGSSFIVSVGGQLVTCTGIDLVNRRLTGASGGTGTVLSNVAVNQDITSPTIVMGVRGRIAASDTGAGQTVIGNVGPLGEAGIQFGLSATSTLFTKSPTNAGVASTVTDQTGFRIGSLAVLSTSPTFNRIRSNYFPSSDRLIAAGSPAWGIALGDSDSFVINRAAATAGVPSFSQLLSMDNTGTIAVAGGIQLLSSGKLVVPFAGNGALTLSGAGGGIQLNGNLQVLSSGTLFMQQQASGSTPVIEARAAADTNDRYLLRAQGQQDWGPGNASADVRLSRDSAGVLRISDASGAADKDLKLGNVFASATATLSDAANIVVGTATGTKIGTSSLQKLGFFNQTPTAQPSGTPVAATDLATVISLANSLRTSLLALGLVA